MQNVHFKQLPCFLRPEIDAHLVTLGFGLRNQIPTLLALLGIVSVDYRKSPEAISYNQRKLTIEEAKS